MFCHTISFLKEQLVLFSTSFPLTFIFYEEERGLDSIFSVFVAVSLTPNCKPITSGVFATKSVKDKGWTHLVFSGSVFQV
jgi:hypothetical protein